MYYIHDLNRISYPSHNIKDIIIYYSQIFSQFNNNKKLIKDY